MHVAMMMDNERLTHEHGMLKRLCIGLIDQGVQITRVVPDRMDEHARSTERRLALAPRIEVPMRVLPWMRSTRTRDLADALERNPPDVIFAIGREAWTIALDVADAIDRPVALDVWSAELAKVAPRRRAARNIGGYIVPTSPLAALLRQRVDPDLVGMVPRGVAVGSEGRLIFDDPDNSIAMAVIGSGRDLPAYRSMLAALRNIARQFPQLQVVLELRGPHGHEIWRELNRLELRTCVSVIEDASLHRSLISRCDALLMPEHFGDVNSMLLESMAVGMAIIAREDEYLDMLKHEETALVLQTGEIDEWVTIMQQCLNDATLARRIGRHARDIAIHRFRSSDQVRRLIDTLEKITTGESYPFPAEVKSG